ncbi:centrosomal protein of 126 kDa [Phaethornis superciliosus]
MTEGSVGAPHPARSPPAMPPPAMSPPAMSPASHVPRQPCPHQPCPPPAMSPASHVPRQPCPPAPTPGRACRSPPGTAPCAARPGPGPGPSFSPGEGSTSQTPSPRHPFNRDPPLPQPLPARPSPQTPPRCEGNGVSCCYDGGRTSLSTHSAADTDRDALRSRGGGPGALNGSPRDGQRGSAAENPSRRLSGLRVCGARRGRVSFRRAGRGLRWAGGLGRAPAAGGGAASRGKGLPAEAQGPPAAWSGKGRPPERVVRRHPAPSEGRRGRGAAWRREGQRLWGPDPPLALPGPLPARPCPARTPPRSAFSPPGPAPSHPCPVPPLPGPRPAQPTRDGALTFHFEWDLEEERQALKEHQKICRSRAQRYLIETNRRRRAFEERRKQEEEKEERLRKQVLQQRKIKLQEATDKFQRAHLPVFHHKQIVQTKTTFQLEEALEQIKGSVLTPGLCLSSRNKNNFRTTDDTSTSSASRNSSCHQKQISAVVGWDKTIQESSRTNMDSNQLLFQKNLKEMQQLLEKQHLSNLENFHQEFKKAEDSESLSSLDSLEAGEQNGNYTTPNESSLTTQCDCALYSPEKLQTRNNVLLFTAQSASKNIHLNNCLRNADSQNNHNLPIHDLLAKHNVLTPAEHVNNSEEESSASCSSGKKIAEFFTSGEQESYVINAFSFLQNIKEERSKPSSGTAGTLATGHPVFNLCKTLASSECVPGERVQDLMQDQSFKMTPLKRTACEQTSSQPIATSIILFPNQGCSIGIPNTAYALPEDKNSNVEFLKNIPEKMTETKKENIKYIDNIDLGSSLFQDLPNASVLYNVKQQNNKKEEKGNTAETKSLMSDVELNSGTPSQHKTLKNNILERKRASLFRSILKKESKCEPSNFRAVVMKHGVSFGTQPVCSVRDSLELAKIKKKSAENEKYNRKLRWCDQINKIIENNENNEQNSSEISYSQLQYIQTTDNAPKTNLSIIAQHSNPMFIKNNQENPHTSKPNVNTEESNKECLSMNIFKSTGSPSAKKAWVISEDEESKSPASSNNSKVSEVKTKINRRPRSVKAQPSVMLKKRIGAIIQPQVPTEANKTLKAPGKLLAPYPPLTPLPGNRSGKSRARPGCQPLLPSSLQTTTTSRTDVNESPGLLADWVFNRNGTENNCESISCHSVFATAIPTLGYSMAKYEPWETNICSVNSAQGSSCGAHSVACIDRRAAKAENRLHPHHSPTDGKTNTLWQAAHTPKGSATGIVRVTRQKQVFDNRKNEHISEQRRQIVASKRWKPTHHAQNMLCAVQLSPVQSAFDPVQNMNKTYNSDEVSESTAQFLMAEKLASTAAAEDEILAALEGVQPASQPPLPSRAPGLARSALSIEEQKIVQSLDHLNQRLQNVQEAITRNPAASDIFQIITPLSIQQCVSPPLGNSTVASQLHQNASAKNRLQLYRRY